MNKIAVLGNSGGGKTTLSLAMASLLGIPCYSVDKAQWRPHWAPVPLDELARTHGEWLAQSRWIIDGWGDVSLLRPRLEAADTIILIEHALWRHCWWALKRQCAGILFARTDTPPGCAVLSSSWRLVRALRWGHRCGVPLAKQILSQMPDGGERRLHLLNSPRALNQFLARLRADPPPRAPA